MQAWIYLENKRNVYIMAGNIEYLKGSAPGHWPDCTQKEGAYYYVQGGAIKSYKKASVLITLPTSLHLRHNTDWGRNAFISLGVDGDAAGAIDIGLRNVSRFGAKEAHAGEEAPTDQGHGWEAVCYECSADKLHKGEDAYGNPDTNRMAPVGTKRARVEVTPNLSTGRQITLYVQWLDSNNRELGRYQKTFDLVKTYDWTIFYRFASLVTEDPNASMRDSTFMLGGTFETAHLGSSNNTNWGINSPLVTNAWMVNYPKCTVPYQWDVGEQFRIDHWA